MIRLYRLDGTEFLLNVNLIARVEAMPETVITLLSGEIVKVKNTMTDVTVKIKASRIGIEEESRESEEDTESSGPRRKFPAR